MKTPALRYLIFYVTARCNLRCRHCFYFDELDKPDRLNLEQIEKVARSVGRLTFLRITGGEPFLRKDLPEVMEKFYTYSGTRRMGVITNGTVGKQTLAALDRVWDLAPDLHLDVGVSIDDLGEGHDRVRDKAGTFDLATALLRDLVERRRVLSNLEVSTVTTVTARNCHRLREIYDYLESLGVDRISCNLIRGKVPDDELRAVDLKAYREFQESLAAYHRRKHRGPWSALRRAKNEVARRAIFNIVGNGRQPQDLSFRIGTSGRADGGYYALGEESPVHCQAARAIAVLKEDGTVHTCELLDRPLGNLRDVDFDWNAVWSSPAAESARRFIDETGCSCTHECFLTASLLFGREHRVQLAASWAGEVWKSLF
ncbi:MAG: radical SAM protein [Planctomycetes bacterium]|nr:radical SAM protein [Planctomycetota bacterium]